MAALTTLGSAPSSKEIKKSVFRRSSPLIPVDRDRLRSVQELRCANCRVVVVHCSNGGRFWLFSRFKREFRKSRGGAGHCPGQAQRDRPKATAGERWVTDAPADTAGCPHPCGVGRSVIQGGRESHALHESHSFACRTQAVFCLPPCVADAAVFALARSDSPIQMQSNQGVGDAVVVLAKFDV